MRIKLIALLLLALFHNASALTLSDWFLRPDQKAANLLKQGQADKAAKTFTRTDWRGVAHYRSGKRDLAARDFAELNSTLGNYNQGTTLAHLGQYRAAIKAFDQVLAKEPYHKDALHNRAIVEKLLQQQQQKKQQQGGQSQNNKSQQKNQQQASQQNKQQQANKRDKKSNQSEKKPSQNDAKRQQAQKPQPKNTTKQRQHAKKKPLTAKQREQQQAKQQLLRQIDDDPAGLLRQKFLRDYLQKRWQQQHTT